MTSDAIATVEALYATGHWLLSAARTNDAIKVFQAMTLIAPSDQRAWVALGRCHEALDQDDVALELYALGGRAAAPAPRCLFAQALLLRRKGDAEGAHACLDAAQDAEDDAPDLEVATMIQRERNHG